MYTIRIVWSSSYVQHGYSLSGYSMYVYMHAFFAKEPVSLLGSLVCSI